MNRAQRIIASAIFFAVCIAALRECIYDKDHDCSFRYTFFFSEIGTALILGWIVRRFTKWNKNKD
jgi:hypothetical protein